LERDILTKVLKNCVVFLGLFVCAFVLRISALPTDGYFHDDAWVAASVLHSTWAQVPWTSNTHLLFSTVLKLWSYVPGIDVNRLVWVPFFFGCLGPVMVYVTLRYVKVSLPVSLIVAGSSVFSYAHQMYSGRLKQYTLDVVLLCVTIMLVHRFYNIRWRYTTAAMWLLIAMMIAATTMHMFVAIAVAGGFMLLNIKADFKLRLATICTQATCQLFYLLFNRKTYNSSFLAEGWGGTGAYINLENNALEIVQDIFLRCREALQLVGPDNISIGYFLLLVAISSMLYSWCRKDYSVRYVSLLLAFLVAANIFQQIPFGGEGKLLRLNIWTIPIWALAVARLIDLVMHKIIDILYKNVESDVPLWHEKIAVVLVGIILTFTTIVNYKEIQKRIRYPASGMDSASRYLSNLSENETVLILPGALYQTAAHGKFDVALENAPRSVVGYVPRLIGDEAKAVVVGWSGREPVRIQQKIYEEVSKVYGPIYVAEFHEWFDDGMREAVDIALRRHRYFLQEIKYFGESARVSIWIPPAGEA
jgi:hypothetical protein